MNWRWVVVAGGLMTAFDAAAGVVAYNSLTMNSDHTEVLTGWPAVRYISLEFIPLVYLGMAVFAAILIPLISWAIRGEK